MSQNSAITVLFFAKLREQLGVDNTQAKISDGASIKELKQQLGAEGGDHWAAALNADNILCAVNQELVDETTSLSPGDEVAFFPPVTGG